MDALVPKPIGDYYCHVFVREGKYHENHEAKWVNCGICDCAVCETCGKKATATHYTVEEFLKNELLLKQLA